MVHTSWHTPPLLPFFSLILVSFSLLFSSLCALMLTNFTLISFISFWYRIGPVRDDTSSASTLQSPIVAAGLGQKQGHLLGLSSVKWLGWYAPLRIYVWEISLNGRGPRLEEESIFLMIIIAFPGRKCSRKALILSSIITTNNPFLLLTIAPAQSQCLLKLAWMYQIVYVSLASILSNPHPLK